MPASPPSTEKDDRPPPPSLPSRSAYESSSDHSGDPSDQRDFDTSTQVMSSKTEEYRLLFRLPHDEVLVQDFNCALQENILLQGHMYLFVHHICFYSNIFGFETKKIIAFHEVTYIRKAKTAAIFPNAIEIVSGEKKNLFGSFFYRDEAYKLIIDGWAQHCSDAKALLDNQESDSDNKSHENACVMLERAAESERLPDNSSSTDRSKDAINSDEKPLPNDKSESERPEKLPDQDNEEQNHDASSSREPLNWQPEDIDAPKIPQHFSMIAEAKFQISVEEFFTLFISDRASDFLEILRRRSGHKDLQYTSWHEHEQYGHARELSYLHPIRVLFGAKSSRCQELQKFRLYRNSHLVIETSQQVSGVPYSDYFTVEGIWDVEKNGNEGKGCILRVYISVPFSKKTIFKGKIEQTTREEFREGFTMWINSAHEFLKQNKMEKLEGNPSQSTGMIKDQKIRIRSCSKEEILTRDLDPTATPATVQEKGADMENFDLQIDNPVQESFGHYASLASVFRESLATFVSYINSQSQFLLYLVLAVVAILILMQISIIVLLNRAPQVHFVTRSLDSRGSEDIGWLERHIGYLKEEVLMLEARMERMHLEKEMIKAHLLSLERLKPKS